MNQSSTRAVPQWFWIAAALGLAWNVFGVFQFLTTVGATAETLVRGGMTASQAAFYVTLPTWLHVVFAVGVFAGALGCVLLLLRRRWSVTVFAISLLAYIALFLGDALLGVFTVLGMPQVIVLTLVVVIAGALLWLARRFDRAGLLR